MTNKGLDAFNKIKNDSYKTHEEECVCYEIVEKELEDLECIEENLNYGYVFIGYDKDNNPLFQFASPKLYEEIKNIKEALL